MTLVPSTHCREKWSERFPADDLAASLARAKYVRVRDLRKMQRRGQRACGMPNAIYFRRECEYWLDESLGVVYPLCHARQDGSRVVTTALPFRAQAERGCGPLDIPSPLPRETE